MKTEHRENKHQNIALCLFKMCIGCCKGSQVGYYANGGFLFCEDRDLPYKPDTMTNTKCAQTFDLQVFCTVDLSADFGINHADFPGVGID